MQDCVKRFHEKNGYPVGRSLENGFEKSSNCSCDLKLLSLNLLGLQRSMQSTANQNQAYGDDRLYRALLMLEELGEICGALSECDEEDVADGLGDLLYVTFGTGVAYDIPLKPVFDEIHRANMAKKKRDPHSDPRMRDKGTEWSPPDIRKAIEFGRKILKERT